jgi:hypothetical protein
MYEKALIVHSCLRWLALAAVAYAAIRALRGWLKNVARGSGDRAAELVATIAVDVQFTVGLLLYAFWSPVTTNAMHNMGAAMKDPPTRFFAVEHAMIMILAVALVHIAKIRARKATSDNVRNRRMAIGLLIALALMIFGTPWPGSRVPRPWITI